MAKSKKNKRKSMKDKARERAQNRETTGGGFKFNLPDGVEFYSPEKGVEKLNIIPYEVTVKNHPEQDQGELWFERTIWVHYGIGIEEKNILCPKTIGKPCPICEEVARMKKDSDADEDDIKALRPRERQIFNVSTKKNPEDVMLFEMSYHLFGKQLEEEIREGEEEWGGFADLEGGYTLKIRWAEKKLGKNAFVEASRIDFMERDDLDEDILDEVLDLDSILNVLSYEELESLFLGLEGTNADNEEEEEDDEPAPRKSKKSRKQEPEEDEDEDPKEEDEDEEEEKPAKRSRKSKKDKKKSKKNKCPFDHEFGTDCDEHDDCDDCDEWDDCKDAQDEQD